jgi:hypothetical protein
MVIVWMHGLTWHGRLARKSWGLGIPMGGLHDDQRRALANFSFFHSAPASYIYYFMFLREKR